MKLESDESAVNVFNCNEYEGYHVCLGSKNTVF